MRRPPPANRSGPTGEGRPAQLAGLARIYRNIALFFFNLVLTFILFNGIIYVFFLVRGPERDLPTNRPPSFPEEVMAKVYPDLEPRERELLLGELGRPFAYQDYLLFKERPIQGRYVNVSEAGFRSVMDQGPWPPSPANLNLFLFGGSTTFGYGLPDHQTFPSFLQQALSPYFDRRLCVYNFASGWYYSTQERVQFESLLADGHVPHVALFIDGYNDCKVDDRLPFSQRFSALFEEMNHPGAVGGLTQSILSRIPLGRAIRSMRRHLTPPPSSRELHERVDRSLRKYQSNKTLVEAVSRHFSIAPVFVWQPVPGYKYDLEYHLFAGTKADYDRWSYGYAEMAKLAGTEDLGKNFIWAADLQENERENLYVDGVHYTAKFNKKIAEFITRSIIQRELLQLERAATGATRPSP